MASRLNDEVKRLAFERWQNKIKRASVQSRHIEPHIFVGSDDDDVGGRLGLLDKLRTSTQDPSGREVSVKIRSGCV
jgi:hypothetical protein